MRAAGNLAGVEFIAPPVYAPNAEQWREIITESGYFFTKAAMRFLSSRVLLESLTADRERFLFITSEKHDDARRRYTVRQWTQANGVDTVGEYREHATAAAARRALSETIGQATTN